MFLKRQCTFFNHTWLLTLGTRALGPAPLKRHRDNLPRASFTSLREWTESMRVHGTQTYTGNGCTAINAVSSTQDSILKSVKWHSVILRRCNNAQRQRRHQCHLSVRRDTRHMLTLISLFPLFVNVFENCFLYSVADWFRKLLYVFLFILIKYSTCYLNNPVYFWSTLVYRSAVYWKSIKALY